MTEPTKILQVDPVKETVVSARYFLVITHLEGKTQKYPLTGKKVLLGKSKECNLILADDYVSSRHCLLEEDSLGWTLSDLGSTNGTFVNGCRVQKATLSAQAEISLGKTHCLFCEEKKEEKIEPLTVEHFAGLVGKGDGMRRLFAKIQLVAPTDHTVLICGESGSGKELVAHALHRLSPRKDRPLVVLNCGAISPTLIESELFGHEKGAFTGAQARRIGALEQADGGTIFLDEIGELPLELQPKLLRVLENRTIRRVGGEGEIVVDVRVIAATHRHLPTEVQNKKFREDLFYRLYVVCLTIPPLRERREDIPLLVRHFMKEGPPKKISHGGLEKLLRYPWPGNVRELKNVILRAMIFCERDVIEPVHLELVHGEIDQPIPLNLQDNEKEKIIEALRMTAGNRLRAAQLLGIAKSTLFKKLKDYGMMEEKKD